MSAAIGGERDLRSLDAVETDIRTIERDELKAKLDAGEDVKLVMAMHEWGFRTAHIPGSLHFNSIEEAVEALHVDDEIVVYCSDPACVASQFAYRWLVANGYNNVRRYSGGVSDWASAGYELESGDRPGSPGAPFFLTDDANPSQAPRSAASREADRAQTRADAAVLEQRR